MANHISVRLMLGCLLSICTGCVVIAVFTLDLETLAAGALVSLLAFPSLALFAVSRSVTRLAPYAATLYAAPAIPAVLLFAVPAFIAVEGRDLAALLAAVLFSVIIIMFPISSVLMPKTVAEPGVST